MPDFAGWADYPLNLNDYDSVTTNGKEWKTLFGKLATGGTPPLFSDEVKVRVWDIEKGTGDKNLEAGACDAILTE